jgi:hypothetical protein
MVVVLLTGYTRTLYIYRIVFTAFYEALFGSIFGKVT